VCLIGSDLGLADAIAHTLGSGFVAHHANWQREQWLALPEPCDVVLLDLRTAGGHADSGLQAVDAIRQTDACPAIVALCDEGDRTLITQVLEHGACDTIPNPPNIVELRRILLRACKTRTAEKQLKRLNLISGDNGGVPGIIGAASVMLELFALAKKVAACDVTVLITGESGTGKELLARAIHHMSPRSAGPLVAFSCANLPESLIEDELFGHEKGAFTGAAGTRRGRLEAADQGTVFLDEIGDIGLSLQPKLLRVLQLRSFERLGSNTSVNVNIRVISATNRNLQEMVQQGKFREDLFYRLNVVHMHLPALRERREDIPLLAHHFLQTFAGQFGKSAKRFSRLALQALEEYRWPGNVRELENVVQRAVVLSEGPTINCEYFPDALRNDDSVNATATNFYEEEVRQFKSRLVLRSLQASGWNIAETARRLGMARGYLHRLIKQLEIRGREENFGLNEMEEPVRPRMVV
jgi:two-component system response regulator AtoC